MPLLTFTAVIQIRGINPYILVSKSRASKIKAHWRKPLPVLVQINEKPSKPWPINMIPVGNGDFYLYLHGTVRKASNTKIGDTVRVSLAFNTSYRNGPLHTMSTEFSNALKKNSKATQAWDQLSPSRKKEILRYFAMLTSAEARARNIAQTVEVLSGKKGRFMARSWINGK